MAWVYADDAELHGKGYRWWRDGKGETPAHGSTAHDRLLHFWRTHQSHIPDSDRFFPDLFEAKVRLEPRITGLRLEAWKACFARLLMTYKRDARRDAAMPRSRHYKQIISAVQALDVAFGPLKDRHRPEVYFEIGGAPMNCGELIDWAESELIQRGGGGRPDVLVFERVMIQLLGLYGVVFGRKPSYASPNGPTTRYVTAFFGILADQVTTESGDLAHSSPEMSKRLSKLLQPGQGAIREMIRRAIPKAPNASPLSWMMDTGLLAVDFTVEQPVGEPRQQGEALAHDPGRKPDKPPLVAANRMSILRLKKGGSD